MILTDLADAARKSGLVVVETKGWLQRGHGSMTAVRGVVCHHTAGPAIGNAPSLWVVTNGRPGLTGPLAHIVLGRDGTVYIVASGLCYHAGVVHETSQGNAYTIGIEAEATGTSPWPAVQYQAYVALCAALAKHYGFGVDRVLGHKEVASPSGRKTDPNFDMAAFRAAVTHQMEDDPMADPKIQAQLDRIEQALKDNKAQHQKTRALIKPLADLVTRLVKKVGA